MVAVMEILRLRRCLRFARKHLLRSGWRSGEQGRDSRFLDTLSPRSAAASGSEWQVL